MNPPPEEAKDLNFNGLHYVLCLVAKSCPTLATPWTVAHQDPLSMGFSRQEYSCGLPSSPPGDLPDPGIKPTSPALASRFFTLSHLGSQSQSQ